MRCPRSNLDWLRRWPELLVSVWLCAFAAPAAGTVLMLRNGDRLTGTILREEAHQVTLRTVWHNVVVVPVAEIKARDEAAQVAAIMQPGAPGQTSGGPVPGTAPAAPLAPKPPPPQDPLHKFSGEAQIGTDLLFSEKNRQLVSGRLKLAHSYERLKNLLDYSFSYGRTEGVLSDNRMFGSVKSDYELAKRFFVYNLGGAGYDEIRQIDLRYEFGPGMGYHLIVRTNMTLNVEVGGNYQGQYLADGTETENFYYRFAESGTWQIHPRLGLDQRLEYFPQFDNWGNYRLRVEGNLRYTLRSNLALVVTVLDEYERITAAGVGENDLQIRSSLSMKF